MRSLADWLQYQQTLHTRGIDLDLERVCAVAQLMDMPRAAPIVISVAGTNGKGSTIAFLEAMLRAAGKRVGCYTSPHLLNYNERIRLNGVDIDDQSLIDAFAKVEVARGSIPLTYFEFGTLAALWIFSQNSLDVALLEVGLGGRLDAVNVVDADAAVITTIDLDHQEYLGNDRDSIGREKAGIARCGRPAIIAEADPPQGLLQALEATDAAIVRAQRSYHYQIRENDWNWRNAQWQITLPHPKLAAPCQFANAAGAIAALYALRDRLGLDEAAIGVGLSKANIAARLQRFTINSTEWVVDVAHNPQAARELAAWLTQHPIAGRTIGVFGVLADKDPFSMIKPLTRCLSHLILSGLDQDSERGLAVNALFHRLEPIPDLPATASYATPDIALNAAYRLAQPADRVVVFGSFYMAGAALTYIHGLNEHSL